MTRPVRATTMWIASPGQKTDIERSAYRHAARTGVPVQVHNHAQHAVGVSVDVDPDANDRASGMTRAACNEGCHLVEPDPDWPPGHVKANVEQPKGPPNIERR